MFGISRQVVAPVLFSFWHGNFGWLERLCVSSMIAHGHQVHIYSYDTIQGLPDGAVWYDASEILSSDNLVFYKGNRSPAVFSDRIRLELLRLSRGVYVDLDIYLLKPIALTDDYLLASERAGHVNNAILHIPAQAPLLLDLLSVFSREKRPLLEVHLPFFRKLEVALLRLLGFNVPPERMQYGATGPMALEYFVQKHNLFDRVLPPSTYYPVPYSRANDLVKEKSSLAQYIHPDTIGVHLWRSKLTQRGKFNLKVPEQGSALHALCLQHQIDLNC